MGTHLSGGTVAVDVVSHIPAPRTGNEEIPAVEVAVLGLGYVGLPTLISLAGQGRRAHGVDIDPARVSRIRAGDAELLGHHQAGLSAVIDAGLLTVGTDADALGRAHAVVICVPTPIDEHQMPDLAPLAAACRTVVEAAVPGQVLVLTSTTYVGCTEDLLAAPLRARGFEVGTDIHVVFSPERIDPGVTGHAPELTPRVIGGVTEQSRAAGIAALTGSCLEFHEVGSFEAAEFTKLVENTFRAVNISFANEMADLAHAHGLDIAEIIDAAATKPYGFMRFNPGPGVGGHCIPCDPHYLLHTARERRTDLPVTSRAMTSISLRPDTVVRRARLLLGDAGRPVSHSHVHVWGVAYKPGIADVRESPALRVIEELTRAGARVSFTDSFVQELDLDGVRLRHDPAAAGSCDLMVVLVTHPDDEPLAAGAPVVLDATYRLHGDDRVVRL